ncbi:unnamed protein product [Closterium sp. NIES-53]
METPHMPSPDPLPDTTPSALPSPLAPIVPLAAPPSPPSPSLPVSPLLVVAMGLPGAGKSTLCAAFAHLARRAGTHTTVVSFDSYARGTGRDGSVGEEGGVGDVAFMPRPDADTCAAFSHDAWKASRVTALAALTAALARASQGGRESAAAALQGGGGDDAAVALANAPETTGATASVRAAAGWEVRVPAHMVVADDTMHLRSMRLQLLRLAHSYGATCLILHVTTPLDQCISRNEHRLPTARLPPAVIRRTAARLEPPRGVPVRGAEEGSASKRGAEEGSASKRGAEEGSASKRGAEEGSANKRGAEEGSANKRGAEEGSANKRGAEEGSASKRGAEGGRGREQEGGREGGNGTAAAAADSGVLCWSRRGEWEAGRCVAVDLGGVAVGDVSDVSARALEALFSVWRRSLPTAITHASHSSGATSTSSGSSTSGSSSSASSTSASSSSASSTSGSSSSGSSAVHAFDLRLRKLLSEALRQSSGAAAPAHKRRQQAAALNAARRSLLQQFSRHVESSRELGARAAHPHAAASHTRGSSTPVHDTMPSPCRDCMTSVRDPMPSLCGESAGVGSRRKSNDVEDGSESPSLRFADVLDLEFRRLKCASRAIPVLWPRDLLIAPHHPSHAAPPRDLLFTPTTPSTLGFHASASPPLSGDECDEYDGCDAFDGSMASEEGHTVYLGGLPFDSDEGAIKKVFEEFGEVLSAKVIYDRETGKARGFGFVTFASPKAAQDAIKAMDGEIVDGRPIKVSEVRRRGDGGFFRQSSFERDRDRTRGGVARRPSMSPPRRSRSPPSRIRCKPLSPRNPK